MDHLRNPDCTACPLHKTAKQICVMGNGSTAAKIMIVGGSPEQSGRELLDEALINAGLNRDGIYMTTVVKCQTPGGRQPRTQEVTSCTFKYLVAEVKAFRPRYVLLMGDTALHALTNIHSGIARNRGYISSHRAGFPGSDVYATFHPSEVLDSSDERMLFLRDVEIFGKIVRKNALNITDVRTSNFG